MSCGALKHYSFLPPELGTQGVSPVWTAHVHQGCGARASGTLAQPDCGAPLLQCRVWVGLSLGHSHRL